MKSKDIYKALFPNPNRPIKYVNGHSKTTGLFKAVFDGIKNDLTAREVIDKHISK